MSDAIKARLDQLYASIPTPTDSPEVATRGIEIVGGPPTDVQLTKIMKRFEARKAVYEREMNQLVARGDDTSDGEQWAQLMRKSGRR